MSVALFTCVFFCFVLARCLFFLICWILFVSVYFVFFFFFSSRRRHTRCLSDWSSDVCSSDLPPGAAEFAVRDHLAIGRDRGHPGGAAPGAPVGLPVLARHLQRPRELAGARVGARDADARGTGDQIGRASCRERGWMCVGVGAL